MAINFPTSLDNFSNPSSTDSLNTPSHSLQHTDLNDAVEALEAKLGIGASPAGSATSGQVLTAQGGGTALWAIPVQGLTQIVPTSVAVGSGSGSVDANGAVTFSGASSVSLNGCFSSTYDNYRITFYSGSASSVVINMRLRVSGSDATGSNYAWAIYKNAYTTSGSADGATATAFVVGFTGVAAMNFSYDIFQPFSTIRTQYLGSQITSADVWVGSGGSHTLANSYDGFTLFPPSGVFAGTIRVYGYRN